jgi:flagellar basal-body rod protein FlgG
MIRALWTAATGMEAQQMNVDVISNNLANVNTTGFKKSRIDFQDLLYTTLKAPGTESASGIQIPTGIQIGNGVRTVSTQKLFSQGDFTQTSNPLDVVIEGDGFFQVLRPDGTTAYTRDGALKVNSEGKLVTSDGFVLQPEITIPTDATDITIGIDGTVTTTIVGQEAPTTVGQIELAKFINPAGLKSIGKNLFEATDASGAVVTGVAGTEGRGTVLQGFLEMSNVKVVEEMVNMIIAQRAYEVNSKAVQTGDQLLQMAASLHR